MVLFTEEYNARIVDHLAVKNVAQGASLRGGSTLHPGRLGQN